MAMEQILAYIETHLDEPMTNRQLARLAGYSEYHFLRLFKEYTNMTCMHYISKRRLIRAAWDIAEGVRIIDAAIRYGWQSHSAFSKSFKREFGFSPSLLRTMRMELDCFGGGPMDGGFITQTKVGETKEQLFEMLKRFMRDNGVEIQEELLEQVYQFSCRVYAGKKRYSGEEYVTHALNVSIILSEMGADANVVLAGMLCDAHAKGCMRAEEARKQLPAEVFRIVSDLTVEKMDLSSSPEEVAQVKLAERLHNMRTIDHIDEAKKRKKAEETVEIFLPLARKMNHVKLLDELHALAVRWSR